MVVQEGPENNIASTFAHSPYRAGSCSCYIIFSPPGGASTFALRLMLLPPLPLPIWYAWLGDDILHPVIGFLRFWACLKAFMCAIYVPIFRRIHFILVWCIFFIWFYIDLQQDRAQNSRIHQEMEFIFFWVIWPARALRNASFLNLVSAPS